MSHSLALLPSQSLRRGLALIGALSSFLAQDKGDLQVRFLLTAVDGATTALEMMLETVGRPIDARYDQREREREREIKSVVAGGIPQE